MRREADVESRGDGEVRLVELLSRQAGRVRCGSLGAGRPAPGPGDLSQLCGSIDALAQTSAVRTLVVDSWRDLGPGDGEQVVRALKQIAKLCRVRVLDEVLVRSMRSAVAVELDGSTGEDAWRALQVAIDTMQALERSARQARATRVSASRRQVVSDSRHTNVNLPHWVRHARGSNGTRPYGIGEALQFDETLRMWNIFRWYLDGESPESIARDRLAGQPSAFSEDGWTAQSVSRYLASRSVIARAPAAGALGDLRQPYPALFTARTFGLVQDLMAARQELGRASIANLVSGRAFCAVCADSQRESRLHYREAGAGGVLRCESRLCGTGPIPYAKVEERLMRWLSLKRDFATELANPLAVDEQVLRQAISTFDWVPVQQQQPDPQSLEEHLRSGYPVAVPSLASAGEARQALRELQRTDAGRLKLRALLLRRLQRVNIRHDDAEPNEREYVAAFGTLSDLLESTRPRERSRRVLHMEFVGIDPPACPEQAGS